MTLKLVCQEITTMKTDAVVNAANESLRMGGGVCGAIFEAAGEADLTRACRQIGGCPVGGAVITDGYHLEAKYIIHAVGPIWRGGQEEEVKLLGQAYLTALSLAAKYHLTSIAFPLISSGIYGMPRRLAYDTAVTAIRSFLNAHDMDVNLVFRSMDGFPRREGLFEALRQRLDGAAQRFSEVPEGVGAAAAAGVKTDRGGADDLDVGFCGAEHGSQGQKGFMDESHEGQESGGLKSKWEGLPSSGQSSKSVLTPLNDRLFQWMETLSMMDQMVCTLANVSLRRHLRLWRSKGYVPGKEVVLGYGFALKLKLEDMEALLALGGCRLEYGNRFDEIIRYCIEQGLYELDVINELLFCFEQPQLIG